MPAKKLAFVLKLGKVLPLLVTMDTLMEPETALKDGNEVAYYIGTQEGFGSYPDTPLFNLKVELGKYAVNSTVVAKTLNSYGYSTPDM